MTRAQAYACKCCRGETGRVGFDSKLLSKLPDQRFLRNFTILDLAPRKLPQSGHVPPEAALLKQYPPLRIDQGCGDNQQCRIFCHANPFR